MHLEIRKLYKDNPQVGILFVRTTGVSWELHSYVWRYRITFYHYWF
jgi:hypothetical protein